MSNVKLGKFHDPLGSELHIDTYLTNATIGTKNPLYVHSRIAPSLSVAKESGKIPKFDQSYWFRDEAKIRAPGTASEGSGWKTTTVDYATKRYSHRHEVPDEFRDAADEPFNLDVESAMFVADKIELKKEIKLADAIFKTSVWDTDKTGTTDFTKFSDTANGTPLEVLTDYQYDISSSIAVKANKCLLGAEAWQTLRWHPQLIDSMAVTGLRMPTLQLLSDLIGMEVIVGEALKTTTAKGTAEGSVTYTRVWGDNALLLYVPERPSLFTPAACYTTVWNRVPNASMWVKRMRDEEREVDIIEGNTYFDTVLTSTAAGLFLSDVS